MVLLMFFLLFFLTIIFFPEQTIPVSGSQAAELRSSNETGSAIQKDRNVDGENLMIYPYERLRVVSGNPVTGIDLTRREVFPELKKSRCQFSHIYSTCFYSKRPITEIANSIKIIIIII